MGRVREGEYEGFVMRLAHPGGGQMGRGFEFYRAGEKTKVTCMYHSDVNKTLHGNTSVADFAHHQLANKVLVQGQAAQFLKPDDPFPYLGLHITMDLNWTHQLTHMTTKLSLKLEQLKTSLALNKQWI